MYKKKMSGLFITFEGIEGCGKSTQIRWLADALTKQNHSVFVTREPGGPKIGEAIRILLLNPQFKEMTPMTELLLYVASRAQHVVEVILPKIAQGTSVISDRYWDSTIAYQGAARAIPADKIEQLHQIAINNYKPDLTFLLDLPVAEGLRRIQKRKQIDRLEQEDVPFHERVREGYLALAAREAGRIKVINGAESIEKIHQEIVHYVHQYSRA